FSSRRRHTRCYRDWSSDVCSSDLGDRGLLVDGDRPALRVVDAMDDVVLAIAAELVLDAERFRAGDLECGGRGGLIVHVHQHFARSEERRVGKECKTRVAEDL